ncbi:Arabinose efflux permease family protein [Alteromonas macleodii]|uniref:Arabinose efflux permease family protein n=1 Tax=Alteromonas macleodii TaxID=28108 RepID=A0A6T9Y4I6_ALTMA|nr:MFS transporter [Alteromonas macleodii]CAB9495774.1 Arabinose efflux permease family protein [Alteromonas macleodii]
MLSPSASTVVFKVLFCALLATSVGQSVMLTTLPSMGRQASLSEFHIATIMSSSALIFAFGTSVWSKVAKRAGFRRILMVGLTGYSLGTFAFASAWMAGFSGIISGTNLFLALLISRSLQSTVMSATPPSAVGYAVAISSPQARVSAISKVTSASNVGQIVGPAYAGLLVGFGLLAPLYSIVLLTLLALALVYFKLPVLPPLSKQQTAVHISEDNQAPTKVPYVFVAACICVFCAMAMMQQSLGFFFIDFYHYTPVEAARQVGFAMMVSAAASLTAQFGWVQKGRISKETMITLALPLLGLAYLLLFLQHSLFVLYFAMALMGLGMGMAYPSLAAAATTYCAPSQQATITGLITATTAMGYVIGPTLAAVVYQVNIALPFAVASVLIAVTTCVVYVALQRASRHE